MSLQTVRRADVADLNPRLEKVPDLQEMVSFLPMSALTAEVADSGVGEDRRYGEVRKGYTPFLNGDLLVAKSLLALRTAKSRRRF